MQKIIFVKNDGAYKGLSDQRELIDQNDDAYQGDEYGGLTNQRV